MTPKALLLVIALCWPLGSLGAPPVTRQQESLWQSLQRYSPIALALSLMALPLLPLVLTGPASLAGTGQAINNLAVNPGLLVKRSAERPSLLSSAPTLLDLMSRMDEVLEKYDVNEPDCRLRLACELHRDGLSPQAASVADRLVRLFG
ncbi:unnamed protein product [Ixodes hexagonus]